MAQVLVLAAGLGKRMRSPLPKVLHEMSGKPILFHILKQVRDVLPHASVGIVVGHAKEQVEAYVRQETELNGLDISFIFQPEQRGTGHAARCAMDSAWGDAAVRAKSPLLILPGDFPLLSARLIQEMSHSLGKSESLRLLTCELPDPFGYGRVVRKSKMGPVLKIVEEKDAKPKEKLIQEVATSIYLFDSAFLQDALQKLSTNNAQGEYYLTDVISVAAKKKKRIHVLTWKDTDDLRGVNDLWELSQANQIMNQRILRQWMRSGVKVIAPSTTFVDSSVVLAEGVTLSPGVMLSGKTRIGKGTRVDSNVVLKDVIVGESVHLKAGTVAEQSQIESHALVGPYAHLRPESSVGKNAKIGNFVELKKAKIGEDSSVAHLSYLGDAVVGQRVNIGCGFVTCNFDGRVVNGERKHRTVIEDDVFLGSDCQIIAPVTIGQGAYVASGSTITEDVPPRALAIARARQVIKTDYALKLRPAKEE
jgi:bifunctional UDP-N-acetylglucosamine pyrophosphorylase/glucosamine-1-phosphate N-acetyltransferase